MLNETLINTHWIFNIDYFVTAYDPADIDGCKLGVDNHWYDIMKLLQILPDGAKLICNNIDSTCPISRAWGPDARVWDCSVCQARITDIANAFRDPTLQTAVDDYLIASSLCQDDPATADACAAYVNDFCPKAWNSLADLTENEYGRLCSQIWGIC